MRGIATSSSIFSTHGSTPPKSDRRTVGGAYSFDVLPAPVRLRLLTSSPRVDRSLRLLCELVVGAGSGAGVASTAPAEAGRGGSSEGVDVDGGGGGVGVGVALALVDGPVCCVVAFKLTFFLCQRPCIDLLRALGPWLTLCKDCSLWGN